MEPGHQPFLSTAILDIPVAMVLMNHLTGRKEEKGLSLIKVPLETDILAGCQDRGVFPSETTSNIPASAPKQHSKNSFFCYLKVGNT